MRVKGKKLTFVQEHKRLPNGVVTQVDRIEHPGAALIIPLMSNRRMIFLKQYRVVFDQIFWELPAGTLDPGEKPRSCARRELREETGFSAKNLRKLGYITPVPGYSNEGIHVYLAEGLTPAPMRKDDDEIIETVILTRRQVKELFAKRRLVDAKTICGLCLAGWL